MNDGLIPQRYAKALYKYALEKKNADVVYGEMKNVVDSFEARPDLQKVLSNPYVSEADKEKVLLAAAGPGVEDDYRSFVKLILNHDREAFARDMVLAYRRIYRAANKIAQVRITVATELPDAEMEKLRSLVRKAFPDATLEFTYAKDPDLIGGFVIDVDSVRMDASLSNEIEQIRQNLLRRN